MLRAAWEEDGRAPGAGWARRELGSGAVVVREKFDGASPILEGTVENSVKGTGLGEGGNGAVAVVAEREVVSMSINM